MPANDPHRPLAAFRFSLEIAGVEYGAFSEVTGLSAEAAVIEYRNGNDKLATVRKLPGLTKYSNVTLKRGYIQNDDLWNWWKTTVNGPVERRTVTITLLDEDNQPARKWEVVNAWPCKWSGPELKATGNEVAIESLELANEGIEQSIG